MKFILQLVSISPDKPILNPETPLKGAAFLEEAGVCLRRSIDNICATNHVTLGALNTYSVVVPQQIALESGKFENTDKIYLPVDEGFLDSFIFHGAAIANMDGKRRHYPYYRPTVSLVSYIDELAVVDRWREAGYPDMMVEQDCNHDIPIVDDPTTDVKDPVTGSIVLDNVDK